MSNTFKQGGADPANGGYWFETNINVNDQKSYSHKFILEEEPRNVSVGYFGKATNLVAYFYRHLFKLHSRQRG